MFRFVFISRLVFSYLQLTTLTSRPWTSVHLFSHRRYVELLKPRLVYSASHKRERNVGVGIHDSLQPPIVVTSYHLEATCNRRGNANFTRVSLRTNHPKSHRRPRAHPAIRQHRYPRSQASPSASCMQIRIYSASITSDIMSPLDCRPTITGTRFHRQRPMLRIYLVEN